MAVVDLAAIRHNVRSLKPHRASFMAVVKANGYGHGDVRVAEAALEAGAEWLGVALVEEGVRLRDGGIGAPILVLTEFPRGSERDALEAGLTPTVYSEAGVAALGETAREAGRAVAVHVKVDTGMHRVGADPGSVPDIARRVAEMGMTVEGLWTHFAKSDEVSDPFTDRQLDLFLAVVGQVRQAGIRPRYLHAANSAATIAVPRSHLDLVRVGIALYGLSPGPELTRRADLRPALSWRTSVAAVKRVAAGEALSYGQRYRLERDATIATVAVGYADGYSRLVSGSAHVLIRGRRFPVAGTVTMDQVMVDCGEDSVEVGDEVVLVGRQGDQSITVDDVAAWMGTINYEVVCGVSERVPRIYVAPGRSAGRGE